MTVKLHLGCGKRFIPGFTHLDIQQHPHVAIVSSVDRLEMFADGSVDLIYASHLLEHFGRHDTERVLKEWFRVLRPGGVLRLAVPDFERAIEVYRKHGDLEMVKFLVGGQRDEHDLHRNLFDRRSLEAMLKRVGFKEVREWDWRKTEHANIDDYSQAYIPHMDKEHGILISLNLEAVK